MSGRQVATGESSVGSGTKAAGSAKKPFIPYASVPHPGTVEPPPEVTRTPDLTESQSEKPSSSDGAADKVLSVSEGLKDVLTTFPQTFVMSDATKPDTPIMFASEGFYSMTGYTPKETIGKNCRFLQGPDTDKQEVARMRACLSKGESYCGRILNYRKDGLPFWNLLTISPIRDDNGQVVKYVGMQVEVSKYTEGAKEADVRPNNNPISLIKYDARQRDVATTAVSELVDAVRKPNPRRRSSAHFVLGDSDQVNGGVPAGQRHSNVRRTSGFMSLVGQQNGEELAAMAAEAAASGKPLLDDNEEEELENNAEVERKARRGIDLATTLERIQKNFVITDPRLPDNPIIFASDDFLELTEYSREEVLGRNCRFLQGPDTNVDTVKKIRTAIDSEQDITVQLLNYTKSGKKFWNLFHLQAVKDKKGELQYFIGVQLDASQYVDPEALKLPEAKVAEGTQTVLAASNMVNDAVKELPDAGARDDIWSVHSQLVRPKPHRVGDLSWTAIQQILARDGKLGLKHFRPIKPLGCGDTGSVHLVELKDTGKLFAMKAMDKDVMINRNKVHRACTEREILGKIDHPFLPTLYASFQTATHVCLITDFCAGGELYMLMERQKGNCFPEALAKFYAAEVLLALEYLHCQGVIYRDLKPENILLSESGHLLLADFDLSFLGSTTPELLRPKPPKKKRFAKKKPEDDPRPQFVAEPIASSNSFVGTEEYIAPEIISGAGHSSQVDWWAYGILLYEMLYGKTPFRGKNRQRTFTNVLMKEITFPANPIVSPVAKQLLRSLLERDPLERLGSKRGASEIKQHPFFQEINWPLIRHQPAKKPDVGVKLINVESAQHRLSVASENGEDMDWDENEAGQPTQYGRTSLDIRGM